MLDVSPDEIKLGYLLLKFLRLSARDRPVNKFNVIGRSGRGEFEMWLQKDVLPNEKQTLIWVWDELKRARLISATGTDLVNPDDWAIVSPKGQTISESDFAALFTDESRERTETGKLIDAVTRIFQRGELDVDLAKIGDRKSDDLPVSFVMIDLDHFKTFNDKYGHAVGDEILRAVAQKIATVVREKVKRIGTGAKRFPSFFRIILWWRRTQSLRGFGLRSRLFESPLCRIAR